MIYIKSCVINNLDISRLARQPAWTLWWCQFSKIFNGRGAIANLEFPSPMISDASCRGYLNTDWVMGTWHLVLYADNTHVKGMLTKSSSINKVSMNWIREIYWLCMIYDIQLAPQYIVDALSRVSSTESAYKDILSTSDLYCVKNFINHA